MGMWALWCCFGVLGCVGGLPVYPGHLNVIIIIIIIAQYQLLKEDTDTVSHNLDPSMTDSIHWSQTRHQMTK